MEPKCFCRRACGTKDGARHTTATLASYRCSTNKLRGACLTAAHAQRPSKSVKCVGRIAMGSSDLYLAAITAPCIIASPKHQCLNFPARRLHVLHLSHLVLLSQGHSSA